MMYESISLRVALCTDTIIYAPFYLAYLANDFKENPFNQNIEISIVDKDNDIFKIKRNKLRGDDFVLFCLLFDIADIGICDPSILIHFFEKPQEFLSSLKDFKNLISDKNIGILEKIERVLHEDHILMEGIQDLRSHQTKILGGLVSNLAANIITNNNDFSKVVNLRTYKCPSTLYYLVGNKYAAWEDFGEELNNYNTLENTDGIITCDLIAVELFANPKFSMGQNLNIYDVSDVRKEFLPDEKNGSFLFSGIIGNTNNIEKQELIQAFLYCIDRKLHKIDYFISSKNFYGLKKYFAQKLFTNNHYSTLMRELFISNEEFYEKFRVNSDINKEDFLSVLLDNFISKLSRLKREDIGIFYSQIEFHHNDLFVAAKNRIQGLEKISPAYYDLGYLDKWHKIEKRVLLFRENILTKFIWHRIKNERFILILTSILAAFGFLSDLSVMLGIDLDYRNSIKSVFWKFNIYPTDDILNRVHDFPFWLFLFIVTYSLAVLSVTYKYTKQEKYVYRT